MSESNCGIVFSDIHFNSPLQAEDIALFGTNIYDMQKMVKNVKNIVCIGNENLILIKRKVLQFPNNAEKKNKHCCTTEQHRKKPMCGMLVFS